jgi:hypothetical protein
VPRALATSLRAPVQQVRGACWCGTFKLGLWMVTDRLAGVVWPSVRGCFGVLAQMRFSRALMISGRPLRPASAAPRLLRPPWLTPHHRLALVERCTIKVRRNWIGSWKVEVGNRFCDCSHMLQSQKKAPRAGPFV